MEARNTCQVVFRKMSLRDVRKRLGLTQAEMADLLGVDQSGLSKIERGIMTPVWLMRFFTLSELLERAGVDFDDLQRPTSSNES